MHNSHGKLCLCGTVTGKEECNVKRTRDTQRQSQSVHKRQRRMHSLLRCTFVNERNNPIEVYKNCVECVQFYVVAALRSACMSSGDKRVPKHTYIGIYHSFPSLFPFSSRSSSSPFFLLFNGMKPIFRFISYTRIHRGICVRFLFFSLLLSSFSSFFTENTYKCLINLSSPHDTHASEQKRSQILQHHCKSVRFLFYSSLVVITFFCYSLRSFACLLGSSA